MLASTIDCLLVFHVVYAVVSLVNEKNGLSTQVCRGILNHAPTGKYYCRFNIPGHETHECECGCLMQTPHHILTQCSILDNLNQTLHFLYEFIGFLMDTMLLARVCWFPYGQPKGLCLRVPICPPSGGQQIRWQQAA